MVGREVGDLFPKTPPTIGDVVLEVEGLDVAPGVFHDVSFTVRAGEIVGLAGLVGAGRSEIARAVFGVDGYDAGSGARCDGTTVPPPQARAPRSGPAWRSSPRTVASRAWSSTPPSRATSPGSSAAG